MSLLLLLRPTDTTADVTIPGPTIAWREPAIITHREPSTLAYREPAIIQGSDL